MKQIYAIIGMAFGDECKGKIVDYLTSKLGPECIVCRFNGGCQAGHTVVKDDGRRHVFSHFGAGSFNGCPTHLSEYFIVNPVLFKQEHKKLNLPLKVTVDPNCYVTTPLDMFLNRELETHRQQQNISHGSCGVGIFETINRSSEIPLKVKDLTNKAKFNKYLHAIHKYALTRLKDLGVSPDNFNDRLIPIDKLIEQFTKDRDYFLDRIQIIEDAAVLSKRPIVFEGAQGLQLSMDNRAYIPYLTPSRTGLKNVCSILGEVGSPSFTAVYVTRTYTTRHGNGPLPYEVPAQEFLKRHPVIKDETNITNDWQGSLRFASFIPNYYNDAMKDLSYARGRGYLINFEIAVTCLDQMSNPILENVEELKYLSRGAKTNDLEER